MGEYKLKCFWGIKGAWAGDQGPDILEDEPANEYDINIQEFETEGEMKAFVLGVEMSNGWDKYFIHEMI